MGWNHLAVNTVHNEDCRDTMLCMPDNFVDLTFTSPPYNRKRNDKYKHYDDTIDDYYKFLVDVTEEMLRVTKRYVFVNIQKNYYNKEEVFRYIGNFSKEICDIFIWEKSNPLPASGSSITNAWEFIIVFGAKLDSNETYTKNHITTSINTQTDELHKAIMNKDVSDMFMSWFAQEGDIVYDPFMGNATTAMSAIEHGCQYIGSEISKVYLDRSTERIKGAIKKQSAIDSIVEW